MRVSEEKDAAVSTILKMKFKETGCEGVTWISLAHNKDE
jgi:hypothetical protein